MAKIEYSADQAIKPLYKLLTGYCGRTGHNPDSVFEGLLDYILGYLNPSFTPQPIENWKFASEDSKVFAEMMKAAFESYASEIPKRGWYDPFGDLYMALHSGGNGKGQFFTPPAVATAVAKTNIYGMEQPEGQITPFGKRIIINDCAAGSGRMPLAGYCEILNIMQREWGFSPVEAQAKRPYIICEDLDYNCVKMSAINLAMHGCFGECVCHDTLTEPDAVRLGFIINETMFPFPTNIPSIRKETDPMRFVSTKLQLIRKNLAEQEQCKPKAKQVEPIVKKEHKQPQQLELW